MIIHGGSIIVSKKVGNAYTAFAAAKSCEIEVDCDELEVSSPDSGQWRTYLAGRLSWRVTVNGLVADIINDKLLMAGTEVDLEIKNIGSTNDSLTGKALCKNPRLTATKGNLAQFSMSFIGNGALSVGAQS